MLPPDGDPRRPLQLAIRWVRAFGIVQLILGVTLFFCTIFTGSWFASVYVLIFLLGPAALLFVLAEQLKRCKDWAATTVIVLAAFVGVCVLLTLIINFTDLPGVVSLMLLFLILAMGELINLLSQSYTAMRLSNDKPVNGFEPILNVDQSRDSRQPAGRK